MTSAQVLLGLAPTILALLGTSTEGAAMMAVFGRRPLLSLLLALGSPNVYFGRALDEYKPLAMLKTSARRFNAGSGRRRVLVNVLEYLRRRVRGGGQHRPAGLAAGRALDLHVHGVPTRRSRWLVVFWSLSVIPVHLLGLGVWWCGCACGGSVLEKMGRARSCWGSGSVASYHLL